MSPGRRGCTHAREGQLCLVTGTPLASCHLDLWRPKTSCRMRERMELSIISVSSRRNIFVVRISSSLHKHTQRITGIHPGVNAEYKFIRREASFHLGLPGRRLPYERARAWS